MSDKDRGSQFRAALPFALSELNNERSLNSIKENLKWSIPANLNYTKRRGLTYLIEVLKLNDYIPFLERQDFKRKPEKERIDIVFAIMIESIR
jgi:hypothetical protein